MTLSFKIYTPIKYSIFKICPNKSSQNEIKILKLLMAKIKNNDYFIFYFVTCFSCYIYSYLLIA